MNLPDAGSRRNDTNAETLIFVVTKPFSLGLRKARAHLQAGQTIDAVRFKEIVNQEVHEIGEHLAFSQHPFHGRQEQLGGNQHVTDAVSHAFHFIDLAIVDGRDRADFFAFSAFLRA